MAKNGTSWKPGQSGNPNGSSAHARRARGMRARLLESVDVGELVDVFKAMLALAKGGDVGAARVCLEYAIGRPTDPDQVELNELRREVEALRLKAARRDDDNADALDSLARQIL